MPSDRDAHIQAFAYTTDPTGSASSHCGGRLVAPFVYVSDVFNHDNIFRSFVPKSRPDIKSNCGVISSSTGLPQDKEEEEEIKSSQVNSSKLYYLI